MFPPMLRPFLLPLFLLALVPGLSSCALDLPDPEIGPEPQGSTDRYLPEPPLYRAEPWITGLEVPWSLVFLSDERALVSERPGRIRLIRNGELQAEPYALLSSSAGGEGVSGAAIDLILGGEGGVLGLAVHPEFPEQPYIYVYQTVSRNESVENRVIRLRDKGDRGVVDKVIIDGIPGWVFHNGGRIAFGPDGLLYITTGEAFDAELAQNTESLGGKILRVTAEGEIPEDNPYPGTPIYSLGHRNPQGLAWHPKTGELFASEHGPSAEFGLDSYDEINVIQRGGNYGWPRVLGAAGKLGYEDPLIVWTRSATPPAGMTFHKGALYVATLGSEALIRVALAPARGVFRVAKIERWFAEEEDEGSLGRLRDVVEGPDHRLYLLTSNRDGRGSPREGDDTIYRLVGR